MGKCNKNSQFIYITLHKKIVQSMDKCIKALNKEIDVTKGEKPFTRSMFIASALCLMFEEGARIKVEKEAKEENENA